MSQHSSANKPPVRLDALTSSRFFAAILIVIYHSLPVFGFPNAVADRLHFANAVSFFFVLSGFILAYVYPSLPTWRQKRRFLIARFARIWPAHVAAGILIVLLVPLAWNFPRGFSWKITAAYLLMIHSWIPVTAYGSAYNGPSWSIATEFGFYLLFPILIAGFARNWWLKLLCGLAAAIAVIGICDRLHLDIPPHPGPYDVLADFVIFRNPLSRVFEFILGMCMCLAYLRLNARLGSSRWIGTLLEFAALAAVVFTAFNVTGWANTFYPWVKTPGVLWLAGAGIPGIGFAFLVLMLALRRGWLSSLMSAAPLVLLGEISYSVYLVHMGLLDVADQHRRSLARFPHWLCYAVFFFVVLIVSHLMWAIVERPCRDGIINLLSPGSRKIIPVAHQAPAPRGSNRLVRWLFQPTVISVVFEVLFVSAAAIGIYIAIHVGPTIVPVNAEQLALLQKRTLPNIAGTRFADRFEFVSAMTSPATSGVKLDLVWRSLKSQRLDCVVGVRLLDATGATIANADYPQDDNRSFIEQGLVWDDTVTIPEEQIGPATDVAVSIYPDDGGDSLPISRQFPAAPEKQVRIPLSGLLPLTAPEARYAGEPPAVWTAGKGQSFDMMVTNVGNDVWDADGKNQVQLGVYFGDQDDAPYVWKIEPMRFHLMSSVAPGESATFHVIVAAPSSAGNYILRCRMVREFIGWSNSQSKTPVNVQE